MCYKSSLNVIYNSVLTRVGWRERVPADLEREYGEDRSDSGEGTEWEYGTAEYLANTTRAAYHAYHAACVASHVMIEDRAALTARKCCKWLSMARTVISPIG